MNEKLVLVVSLWLTGDDVAGFEAFERQASSVMAAHGGRIERVIRLDPGSVPSALPFEIHLVTFPDRSAFEAYRDDPRARALADARAHVIARTEVALGRDVAVY